MAKNFSGKARSESLNNFLGDLDRAELFHAVRYPSASVCSTAFSIARAAVDSFNEYRNSIAADNIVPIVDVDGSARSSILSTSDT